MPAFASILGQNRLALTLILVTGLAGVGAAEPRFLLVADPVQSALDAAADGRLDQARATLEQACEESPADSEAWAALSAVCREAGDKGRARAAEKKALAADPEQGSKVLRNVTERLRSQKAERLAEKERRGEIPLPVSGPEPTPDAKVWDRLELERRPAKTPAPVADHQPRLSKKKKDKR